MFEIGNSLREARERQGRTFADLERKTEIRTRYLKALEEEQFSLLPAPAYMRGFLRVYADELGLDGQLYVDEFNSRFTVSEAAVSVSQRRERRTPVQTRHSRRVATGAVVISLAIIIVVSIVLVAAFTSKSPKVDVANLNGPTTSQEVTTLKITAVRGDVSVNAHTGGQNGELLYGGMLLKGHHLSFTRSTIWIRVTAIQNVSWTLAGGTPATAGKRVGPATVLFTPNGPTFLTK
jgi:cytoskeletal protein RodZ